MLSREQLVKANIEKRKDAWYQIPEQDWDLFTEEELAGYLTPNESGHYQTDDDFIQDYLARKNGRMVIRLRPCGCGGRIINGRCIVCGGYNIVKKDLLEKEGQR